MDIDKDSAQVRIPPPLFLLSSILLGAGLQWIYPIPIVPDIMRWILSPLFVLSGIAIVIYCVVLFKKAETDIKPWKTTSHLVTSGIYQFSRNPIYFAFVLIGLGIAFAINSFWIALFQIPLVLMINRFVIAKE